MRTRMAIFTACILMLAAAAFAQTATVNPKTVQFTPSADHSATGIDGKPVVVRYELRMFVQTGMAQFSVTDLGKPVPDGTNTISITNPVWFAGLTPNTVYVAKVAAIGGSGEGLSDPSNPFGNVGPPAKPLALLLK